MEGLLAECKLPIDFVKGSIPLERYYEALNSWRLQSESANISTERRFVLLMRLCSLYAEHLPKHKDYHRAKYVKWHAMARMHIEVALKRAEDIKAELELEWRAAKLGLSTSGGGDGDEEQQDACAITSSLHSNKDLVGGGGGGGGAPTLPSNSSSASYIPLQSVVVPDTQQNFPALAHLLATPPVAAPQRSISMPPSRTTTTAPPPPMQKPTRGRRGLRIPHAAISKFNTCALTNTRANIETCAVLAGDGNLNVTHVILPQQKGSSDMCAMTDEGESALLEFQLQHNLITLGWIHTHPQFDCFLSSIDLHTQAAYQVMLEEAVAIVVSPRQGAAIFSLTPQGMQMILQCPLRGFHPHKEPGVYGPSNRVEVLPHPASITLVDLRKT